MKGSFISEYYTSANIVELSFIENLNNVESSVKKINCSDQGGLVLIGGSVDWDSQAAKAVPGLENLHRIEFSTTAKRVFSSSSASHAFFLLSDDTVYSIGFNRPHYSYCLLNSFVTALGKNDFGQLGIDNKETTSTPTKVKLPGKVVKISAGRSHSLFLLENGDLYGCGNNAFGQLGLGSAKFQLSPKKISLENIRDISCGYDFSVVCDSKGYVYTFGHPENGQLGNGSTGEYLKDSGSKGPAVQYAYVTTPKRVDLFVSKDAHGKVKSQINYNEIFIRAVAAGKNHVICIEEWENSESSTSSSSYTPLNRLYSWGFGGYGRLGHNDSKDEYLPREIAFFSHYPPNSTSPAAQNNRQKQIREVICGSTFSIAISVSKHFYFWGKMSNSPRGESAVYPKMQQELYDWPVKTCFHCS